jgi:hypothetical protein
MDSICQRLSKTFPNHNIYVNNIPQGFKRPSLYVSLIDFNDTDVTKEQLRREVLFNITYFAPIDERGNVDKLAQAVSQMTLANTFANKYLEMANEYKYADIIGIRGLTTDLDVNLRLLLRHEWVQNNIKPEEAYDLMRKLQIKYIIN